MPTSSAILDAVTATASLRELRPQFYSALPALTAGAKYDGRAKLYDRVVGSAIYNRLLWGTATAGYRAFVERALKSGDGPMLDAGCGSAVFSAAAYARTDRPVLLVDQSLGMLQAAHDRIAAAAGGRLPANITFLQADLFDLPIEAGAFETVLSMGMLHLFDDPAELVRHLLRVLAGDGRLLMTSLVAERFIGRSYLRALHRAGEVAQPRRFHGVRTMLTAAADAPVDAMLAGSMGYFVVGRQLSP